MSLVRIAARIAAVQALKGRTLVGDNVLDSQIGALDVAADGTVRTDEDRPFISVYSDAGVSTDAALRSWVDNGETVFLFEAGVTAAHTDTDDNGNSILIGTGIPATDAALEFHLDIVVRQIGDALSDPENEWAQIFSSLTCGIDKLERARTGEASSGIRLAAQQVKMFTRILADPVKGSELRPTSAMARFLAKAEELTGDYADQVALIREQINGSSGGWQQVWRRYGLTHDEADAMLITAPEGVDPDISVVVIDTQPAGISP